MNNIHPTITTTSKHDNLLLTCLPVLNDNYIWLLTDTRFENKPTYVIDPGESTKVLTYIDKHQFTLVGILLTHHHYDHTDGVNALKALYHNIPVYGPKETQSKGATHIVEDNQSFLLFDRACQVIETPGHTLGHVCYYTAPFLFSGDTLFSAGCGRLFEGSCEQMFDSFKRLYLLPDETLVCAAHEYTLQNLQFYESIDKFNKDIEFAIKNVEILHKQQKPSLPTLLSQERLINPYLSIIKSLLNAPILSETLVNEAKKAFCDIRKLKDNF